MTPAWFELYPHPVRERLVRDLMTLAHRYVGVCAGRQTAKTEIARRRLVLALPVKKPWSDPRYFFAADTATKAYGIAFEQCLKLIPKSWILGKPFISRSWMEIKTVFGSSLRFGGLKGCEWIEGLPWDGGIADEACDCPPRAWDISILPALMVREGWCVRQGAAKRTGIGAAAFREWLKSIERGEQPDCASYSWTAASVWEKTNPEFLKTMASAMDARDYNEQMNAVWETLGGLWLWAFGQENQRACAYDPSLPLIVGQDFNVDPMSWVLGHVRGDCMEWFDELWMRDTNTPAALNMLWGKYSHHQGGFRFYPDAASRQRKTSAHQSDYAWILADQRFKNAPGGCKLFAPAANPPVHDRFAAVNAMFCNAAGERRMFVDPRCKHLLDDIQTQVEGQDDDNIGHMNDAMGYAVWSIFGLSMQRLVRDVPRVMMTKPQ